MFYDDDDDDDQDTNDERILGSGDYENKEVDVPGDSHSSLEDPFDGD